MKNNTNYAALSVNDIIFIDRNKDYGAYELRESYNRRIKQSMLGAMLLTFIACGYQQLYSMHHPASKPQGKEVIVKMSDPIEPIKELTEPAKPELPKPQGSPDPTPSANAVLVPTNSDQAADSIPTNDMLALNTNDNKTGKDPAGPIGTTEGATDIIVQKTIVPPITTPTVDVPETMPEYPGGEKAMMRFLADNIQYPDLDKAIGRQGRVIVGFVIDENGKVTNIKILRGQSHTLDDEAMRVVAKLEDFSPGMQGGHKVRVRYTLPINYQLRD